MGDNSQSRRRAAYPVEKSNQFETNLRVACALIENWRYIVIKTFQLMKKWMRVFYG
ncbi:hypothetical protein SAMN05444165_1454 [Paraburkholderia phenazinium]|uniref:Uncharacterized protein n=1 Tax=Paraburkholderia phenazinium TaxID=60549 RepID=A0A1N6HLS4_9BURK|nr:hypothetical protein SAMN05444165_1454 [Paraburkholderia phenazinium]